MPGDIGGIPRGGRRGPIPPPAPRPGSCARARPAARPKIRLSTRACRRRRPGRDPSPAAGRCRVRHVRGHSGRSSELSAGDRPARAARRAPRDPPGAARAQAAAGAALGGRPAPGKAQRAAARARLCWRPRRSFTNLPVSMPTGQASRQVPSAAHVCEPSYSNSSSSDRSTGEPGAWRAISRRSTIRWRGVVVRCRLGQTGSQNPHSTQVSHLVLDRRRRLEVAQVGPGVVVDHDARPEDPVGVGEPLDPPHHLGRLGSPLALDERRHVHAGAVLGLQRAVVAIDDERDQPLHEGVVTLELLGLGEVRREHEVQVPRRRVAGDPRQEAVLGEQRL